MGIEETMLADYISMESVDDGEAAGWRITDDAAADWAVKKIMDEKGEFVRLKALADEQITQIEARLDAVEKRMESRTGFLTGKLAEYFQTVPHRETKTQEQYALLSGKLVWTRPKTTLEKDDTALLAYLKASGNNEYIKTEEKPMWGEFKKTLAVVGGHVVSTETGDVIDCITAVEQPGSFDVKGV